MKNDNAGLKTIVVILVIIVLSLVGYIVYDKVLVEKDVTINKEEYNPTDENILNSLGKHLYEIITPSKLRYENELYPTEDNIININNIPNRKKLATAYQLSRKEVNYEFDDYNISYLEKIDRKAFEKYYYNIFGNNTITYEEFGLHTTKYDALDCNLKKAYNDEYILCDVFEEDLTDLHIYLMFLKNVEKQKEDIIITVEESIIIEPQSAMWDEYETLNNSEFYKKYSKFIDETIKYKVTFKLNENKDYYWYQTEKLTK